MRKSNYIALALLVLLVPLCVFALMGGKKTGESGSFVITNLWSDWGYFGTDKEGVDIGIIEIKGNNGPSIAAGPNLWNAVYATPIWEMNPGISTTVNDNGVFTAYPKFELGAGSSATHATDYLASYWSFDGTGTVTNFAGFTIWLTDMHLQQVVPTNLYGIRTVGTEAQNVNMKNNLMGKTIIGIDSISVTNAPNPSMVFEAVAFADLAAAPNGTFAFCSNCTIANPCASGGSGAFSKRLNGVWVCN